MALETQKAAFLTISSILQRMQMNSQVKRYIGKGPEESQVQEFVFPWNWHMDIVTNPEAPRTQVPRGFMEDEMD